MGALATAAFALPRLTAAWQVVLDNDAADQRLSPAVSRFAEDAETKLAVLADDLATGSYRVRDLTEVRFPEDDGDERVLHIPAVRDRIVERSILDVVTPIVDPVLGCASYAYRPGLGVREAVLAVVGFRAEGLGWVVRADIHDCFPSVNVPQARRRLGALVPDDELLGVVDALLARRSLRQGKSPRLVRGLPQGSPLSPLLSNLLLVDVDEHVMARGFAVARYADDIVVAATSRDSAWEALRVLNESVEELGMSLGEDKTTVTSFEEGFCFVGEDFGPAYPPATDTSCQQTPTAKVLYVGLQGSRVRTQGGRVIVDSKDDAELLNVPQTQVGRLVCLGSVAVSAGFRSWALAHDVETVLASRRGKFLGVTANPAGRDRLVRLRAQLALAGSPHALTLARALVEAKLRKQVVVLQRFGRGESTDLVADAISQIRQLLVLLPDAHSTQEVMGLEGAAARAYFGCYGQLLPEPVRFQVRSRRPPADVANAALSLLYMVLLSECVSALHAAGLDPALGILHSSEGDRPSLALDLLEEFRPMVVDQVVLRVARSRALTVDHGRREPQRPGVLLTKAGREAVLDEYERRMLQMTRGALPDFAGTIRRHVYRQAHRLRWSIQGADEPWTGLSWR
ncbi:MAG: CRISPR-associated endonuclease Cas1 [Actinomycetales bacterium]